MRQTTVAEWVTLRPIFDMCARETGYDAGGVSQGAFLGEGVSEEADEYHGIINFGISKGAVATGIRKAWRE